MADSVTIDFSGVVAALNRNSDLLERVIAGQEAAIAKLGEAKPASSRSKKIDPVAAAADAGNAAAGTASQEPAATAAADATPALPTSAEEMKALCGTLTSAAKDADDKAARIAFLRDAATKLGGAGSEGLMLDAKRATFWIERKKAGLDVDLDAAYDFDGSPTQDAPVAPAADDFG